uniref:Uncharacterized protein n=1 Tax=Ditylenchus dipsaci TaxID=166011 RepID=A0A915EA55_9BILA
MMEKLTGNCRCGRAFPRTLNATREWFRIYKYQLARKLMPLLDGEYKDKDFAHKKPALHSTQKATMKELLTQLTRLKWSKVVDSLPALGSAADEPEDLQKWHLSRACPGFFT